MKRTILFVLMILFIYTANASIDDAMNNFYNNVTVTTNPATAVQTQSANIYSAGGFSTRSQSVTFQPFSFTKPSFSASCGNIDFYGGAISFFKNGDQLMKYLQNTIITAGTVMFINTMKSLSPNLAGTIMSFFDASEKLLNMSSNSCQMGTYLGNKAGSMGGALANAMGWSNANSEDAGAALTGGTVGGNGSSSLSQSLDGFNNTISKWSDTLNGVLNPDLNSDSSGLTQQIAQTYGSVIWKGLQQLGKVQCSTCTNDNLVNIANLVVSLTGDVYITAENGITRVIPIPAQIQNISNFYTGLPDSTMVYNCPSSDYNPLDPVECYSTNNGYGQTVPLSQGFKEQVMTMVQHLQNHFVQNTPLSQADLQLIAISKIPVYQMAQALQDAGLVDSITNILNEYSEYIAYSLTQSLMTETLSMARTALLAKNVEGNDQAVESLRLLEGRINEIKAQLNIDGRKYANKDIVQMIQDINYLRSMAQSQYSPSLVDKLQFARSFNNN